MKEEKKINAINAIDYRLVSRIIGNVNTVKWGHTTNSLGKEEAIRVFNKKYRLINFRQFEEEIFLAWWAEKKNIESQKMTMSKMLQIKHADEEKRRGYKIVVDGCLHQDKETKLSGVPDTVFNNHELIKNSIQIMDEFYAQLLNAIKDDSIEEVLKGDKVLELSKTLQQIELLEYEEHEEAGFDDFLEITLRKYIEKIDKALNKKAHYDAQQILRIRAINKSREYTIGIDSARRKTKKTILEHIEQGTLDKIKNLEVFLAGYVDVEELYDLSDVESTNLDWLVKYYLLEKTYNIVFYSNIVIDLLDHRTSKEKELIEKLCEFAISDNLVYRSANMRELINRTVLGLDGEKEYEQTLNEIKELISIKEAVVNDLLKIQDIDEDEIKKQSKEFFSVDFIQEIREQIKKIRLSEYLSLEEGSKEQNKVYRKIKNILNYNANIIKKRQSIKNRCPIS